MKKTVLLTFLLLSVSTLEASQNPTFTDLLIQEKRIAGKITEAYRQGKATQAYITRLQQIQAEIKRHPHSREADEMIRFIDYCIADLNEVLNAPQSQANLELVEDLEKSIQEGSRYIGHLNRDKALAVR